MNRIRWYGPTLAVLITVMLVMIAGPRLVLSMVHARESAHIELASQSLEQSELLIELSEAFRNVAKTVQPSVVSIQTFSKRSNRSDASDRRLNLFDLHDLFRRRQWPGNEPDNFDDDESDLDYDEKDESDDFDPGERSGSGSGWVYDTTGHIITNHHVITKESGKDKTTYVDTIEVHFANGDMRIAEIVSSDPDTDVAVIKVKGDSLHPAKIAVEPVHQGDMVFAFGSPLQLEFSMSQGVVSGLNRELGIIGRSSRRSLFTGYENFIQTDAAINRGNSGGPLTNIYGQVVGMNTLIVTNGGFNTGFIGLGFAIPVDIVRSIAKKIITYGQVRRGWLGISYAPLDSKQAKTYGYDGKAMLIEGVLEDGPADKAGLKRNDLLVSIDDVKIKSSTQLKWLIAEYEPGSEVAIEVFRDGKTKTITVALDERPAGKALAKMDGGSEEEFAQKAGSALLRKIGLEKSKTLDEDVAERLDLDVTSGVLVLEVRPGSIADLQRIRAGYIITHVMGKPVKSKSSFTRRLNEYRDEELVRITVLVSGRGGFRRGYSEQTLFLEIPKY